MSIESRSSLADDRPISASLPSRLLARLMPGIACGKLRLVLPGGPEIEVSGRQPGPEAFIRLHRWRGLARIFLGGDHGFAEAYMRGDWSTPDLPHLLRLCMRNETELEAYWRGRNLARLRNRLKHFEHENTRSGSRRNVAAHYDLGNAFYAGWLDRDMNYSSALYTGEETLEAAQQAKLDRVVSLLELSGGERVLEIGCGWGALAERLARQHGCRLLGVTLSAEQHAYARARLAPEIVAETAEIRLQDYRDVSGKFDRIVSIEMLEAVGERYWRTYFEKLAALLAVGGVAVLQVITIEESRFEDYRRRPDFIQRYIFRGGMLPTKSAILRESSRAGLALTHVQSFGESYARTLRDWRARFEASWDRVAALGFDERFRRMWSYYLAYCEAGFTSGATDVSYFRLGR